MLVEDDEDGGDGEDGGDNDNSSSYNTPRAKEADFNLICPNFAELTPPKHRREIASVRLRRCT